MRGLGPYYSHTVPVTLPSDEPEQNHSQHLHRFSMFIPHRTQILAWSSHQRLAYHQGRLLTSAAMTRRVSPGHQTGKRLRLHLCMSSGIDAGFCDASLLRVFIWAVSCKQIVFSPHEYFFLRNNSHKICFMGVTSYERILAFTAPCQASKYR